MRWIMACVSSVSYCILLNGSSHGFIKPERGLRQGDPLSIFLFILYAEALVNCLNHSAASDKLHGIGIGSSGPKVHHLLFADDSLLLCKASSEEAMKIMNCFKLYGDALGQRINLEKSSIIFGSKVSMDLKVDIKTTLGIDKEGGEGTYLGLPECFSGSKRQLLSFLRGKLNNRLNGWFSKALSQGGKEILLKSICLALPIYAISCFRLPKDTCASLRSAMIEFWWSSGTNRKKIAWVAWQKLCRFKDQGGLGFKDLEKFNQSLLAKQAARILENPDSLVAQVLKQRYFCNSTFMESSVGSRPSFAWRSILHGRELRQQGLVTKIGNGASTKVWWDKWIIDSVPRTPNYRPDSIIDLALTVEDLIDPQSGIWNRELVLQTFDQRDAKIILRIKPLIALSDSVVWGFTKNGVYSSKSGYALLEAIEGLNSPLAVPVPPIEKQLRTSIWRAKTTTKLRHFIWRSLSGALAVKDRLCSRGIQIDPTCPSCGNGREDINHVLFKCRFGQAVWSLSAIHLPPSGSWSNSVFLNIFHLVKCSKKVSLLPEAGLFFPWVLWHIWKARNAFCFEFTRLDPSNILEKAIMEAEIWLNLQKLSNVEAARAWLIPPSSSGWSKPLCGWTKCNVAASWVSRSSKSGGAWIARDNNGVALIHSRRAFSNAQDPLTAALISLLWSINDLRSLRMDKIIFETSSYCLRDVFLHPVANAPHRQLITANLNSLKGFVYWIVEHVVPDNNKVASLIAASVTKEHRYQSYVASGGPSWCKPC